MNSKKSLEIAKAAMRERIATFIEKIDGEILRISCEGGTSYFPTLTTQNEAGWDNRVVETALEQHYKKQGYGVCTPGFSLRWDK